MSKDNNFLQSLAAKTSLPCDLLEGEFRLELRGSREMYICGCKKILEYSEERIVIRAKLFNVVIEGHELECASFHCSGIVVEGSIKSIDLESFS